jgi:hypothetical protein
LELCLCARWRARAATPSANHLFRTEILGPLNPRAVAAELTEMASGGIPVLLCFEWPGQGLWCHRAMVAEWLAEATARVIPEFGFETLPQHEHPLMSPSLRRPIAVAETTDVTPYIGRSATIDGEMHRVVGDDLEQRGRAIISAGDRQFSTSIETLRRHFG